MTQADEKTLEQCVEELKLTVDSEFVPFSQSRNAKPNATVNDRSLNWRVTLKRDGRPVVSGIDYSAGIAHCPSYKQLSVPPFGNMTVDQARAIEMETEEGRGVTRYNNQLSFVGRKPILPDPLDVIASLAMDSDVLDYPTFEDWAGEFGYDEDSRKGEAIYRACLEIGLKMRAGLGDAALAELQAAARNR
jgi:hypothetical protein